MTELKNYSSLIDKYILIPVSISVLTVTMDLIITNYLLLNPNFYETRPFGNQPFIYYPWMLSITVILYAIEKRNNLNHIISMLFSSLPLMAFCWNLQFLM